MSFLAPVAAIAGSIFGGDKASSSSSSNQAFKELDTTYGPQTHTGVGANNFQAGLLGVPGGDAAGSGAGFKNFLSMAGYAPALQRLQAGITQGAAARGLLNSGSTQKALVRYGSDLDQQYFQNYFNDLNTLNSQGLEAGKTISGAGQTSSSSGAQPGLLSKIGAGINAAPQVGTALMSIFGI